MFRILLKIWPAITPIVLLLLWYAIKYSRVRRNPDIANPKLRDEPWIMALGAGMLIAIACLFMSVLLQDGDKGRYVPATIVDGVIQQGNIAP